MGGTTDCGTEWVSLHRGTVLAEARRGRSDTAIVLRLKIHLTFVLLRNVVNDAMTKCIE